MYRWGYGWNELLNLYKLQQKNYIDRRNCDYEFLVNLAQAALGGGKKEGEVGLDSGEGMDELSEEKIADLRMMLGKDFNNLYPQYAEENIEE